MALLPKYTISSKTCKALSFIEVSRLAMIDLTIMRAMKVSRPEYERAVSTLN